ncbi:hypothetical protein ACHAXS_006262, partial [Conticribra weissflogii]
MLKNMQYTSKTKHALCEIALDLLRQEKNARHPGELFFHLPSRFKHYLAKSILSIMTNTVDTSKLETRLFINNEFVNSVSGKTFETINPATEEVICSVQEAGPEDVDKAVAAAKAAFEVGSPWRNLNGSDRRDLMLKLADLIERDRTFLEVLEAMDNGKPIGTDGRYGTSVDLH